MSVIKVEDVKKQFKVYLDKGQSVKERLLFRKRNRYEERVVLDGVSFEVDKGQAVGLIGQNGCGKSTLLKLLTKIMHPDSGSITVEGRVSSLIELGAGFHPDMSGRENIYTNASIFGLTKKEIDARLEKIIDFSELSHFIDNPVRTYSSGMYMRLAFAVAINVDADVLLIDEILAVGDASFQAKCFNKLQEIKRAGTTIVLVSHDTVAVERFCDKAIWIKDGKVAMYERPRRVIQEYLDDLMNKKPEGPSIHEQALLENSQGKRFGNHDLVITKVEIHNESRNNADNETHFETQDTARLHVEYKRVNPNINHGMFAIDVIRNDGIRCFSTNTFVAKGEKISFGPEGGLDFYFKPLGLLDGEYIIDISFHDEMGVIYEHISEAVTITVYSNKPEVGIMHMVHDFECF